MTPLRQPLAIRKATSLWSTFFDYNCPPCRNAALNIQQAIKDDWSLKLVFKEFPILGPASKFAAVAALASHKQGKYEAFHRALMGFHGLVNERSTLTIAAHVGLDVEQLKRDMKDPASQTPLRAMARSPAICTSPARRRWWSAMK
ncbi:DsbA family protein [Mesorhizobium sp. AR07]|uniref:DsbA family protein n=1 Tax=Mesorhizobium sp. AR07 TaxID=2865838 RepID=UPI00215E83EC|nr:DsbA family protein [Mesorhizobium sp. AR07]